MTRSLLIWSKRLRFGPETATPRKRLGVLAALAIHSFLLLPAHAQIGNQTPPENVGMSPERLARIREMLQDELEVRHIGSAVGLIARDGKIVLLEALGEAAPGIPMFDDAILRFASAGKVFTAVAALILYERGVLTLADPVAKYIPIFSEVKVAETDATGAVTELVEPARPITIRDLLTHTGGLTVVGDAFEEAWAATEGKTTTRDLAERMALIPLHAHPGKAFQYGSYGSSYEVLAAVIEEASGETLEAFLHENLFQPLEMNDTYFWVPKEKRDRLAAIYRMRHGELSVDRERGEETPRSTFIAGGGGVRSTVRDVYRFGQMLLNGGQIGGTRILSPKTVNLMVKDHVGDLLPWGNGEYGWGFDVEVRRRVRDYDIGSEGTFGWAGGAGAKWWVDPAERIVAVLVAPYAPPAYWETFDKFERLMYAAVVESRSSRDPR